MNARPLYEIGEQFRAEAERFRSWGQESCALLFDKAAAMADELVREWEMELLTLDEAAQESGYSYSALEKGIRAGRLENGGEEGRPRIRRRDLPAKPKRRAGIGIAELVLSSRENDDG